MTENEETQNNKTTFPDETYVLAKFTPDKKGFSIECNKMSPALLCEVVNQLLGSYVFPFVVTKDDYIKQTTEQDKSGAENETTINH